MGGTRGARELPREAGAEVSTEHARDGAPTVLNQEQGAGEGGQGDPPQHHHLWVISGLWNPEGILRGQVISGIRARAGGGCTTEVPPSHSNPLPWPLHDSLF